VKDHFSVARKFLTKDTSGHSSPLCLLAILAVLAGCGSGSIVTPKTSTGDTTTPATGGTTATVTTAAPSFSFTLNNSAGATVTTISNGAPGTLKATLKNAAGAVVPNAVVTFSTEATLVTISPAATALTNASGVATVTLNPATILTAGSTTIKASAQVGTTAVSDSIGFTVGTAAVTVSAPVLGVGAAALSAFGTTSIDVTVSVGGVPVTTPQNVTFSSVCANIGKAELSTGAVTAVGGVARGSYRDNGCAGTDTITATAAGVTSASTSLVVTPPSIGSIQFVSASPASLSLKGVGGTEASLVTFKVLDTSGKPLSGKTVTFGLSTTVGGITLTPSVAGVGTATSDASGLVVITVNSGTFSTPVRVTASTIDTSVVPAATLTTQSSGLTITTGIPDQDSFSLGATILNPEFRDVDGNTTVLTVRLGDHFNNPVPDGTVVNFTTEGGSIVASCSTVASACSSTLISQAPRPADGRVTVLAYAVGEESFTDLNGNGVADLAPVNELVDGTGASTDLSEAFRDDNENGVRDANEPFIDFNQNGAYDGPDGKFSGVLCDSVKSSAGTCSTNKSIHVRKQMVIVFSGSTAVITLPAIDLNAGGGLAGCGGPQNISIGIVDVAGNVMPAGTKIELKTTNGTLGTTNFLVTNSNQLIPAPYTTTIRGDGSAASGACVDSTSTGALTVTVTTPGGTVPGTITTRSVTVSN